jgi:bifunctional UDP-N-acetylglucosamine pyrophosphorylase/glucosamine-1-phosphate N-acetyltransferase
MSLSIIILAAGQGTRMRSKLPKVLHTLAGKPILRWVVETAERLNPDNIYMVYGFGGEQLQTEFHDKKNITWIKQTEQLGTGHAVMQVMPHLKDNEQVLILVGDTPLIESATLASLVDITPKNNIGLLTVNFDNPTGFGRIIRNSKGCVTAIVEDKDATAEQGLIKEINTGIMVLSSSDIKAWLPKIRNNNKQQEYYLTDVMSLAVNDQRTIYTSQPAHTEEVLSVNNRQQLAVLERYYQQQVAKHLMMRGVTLHDPSRFDLRGSIRCGEDVEIDINVIIQGEVVIGNNVTIGANVILKNVVVGDDTIIKSNCDIDSAVIGKQCEIGPFARIRPNTELADHVKVGNFVETKKTKIAKGSKVNHLSYIGDAEIGEKVNIGAGVITCNYDGVNKHKTIIEDGAFIGSDSQLVAPVTIGKGAYIGSGSTINKNAPPGKLTLCRARQITIDKWQPPKQ